MRAKILNASAGSGKTYQLAYNYVRELISQPASYRHILAVTFTNKATEEMKSRILKEIHRLAADYRSSYRKLLMRDLGLTPDEIKKRATEARSKILHDYSRFTVLTIDTFFQRILRAFIKELGLDLNYNIELETASILTKSADTLIEEITTNRELLGWLTRFVEERIEEGKGWDVREGILALGDEIFKERNKQALLSSRSREELHELVQRTNRHAEASKAELRYNRCVVHKRKYRNIAGNYVNDKPASAPSPKLHFWKVRDKNVHCNSKATKGKAVSRATNAPYCIAVNGKENNLTYYRTHNTDYKEFCSANPVLIQEANPKHGTYIHKKMDQTGMGQSSGCKTIVFMSNLRDSFSAQNRSHIFGSYETPNHDPC